MSEATQYRDRGGGKAMARALVLTLLSLGMFALVAIMPPGRFAPRLGLSCGVAALLLLSIFLHVRSVLNPVQARRRSPWRDVELAGMSLLATSGFVALLGGIVSPLVYLFAFIISLSAIFSPPRVIVAIWVMAATLLLVLWHLTPDQAGVTWPFLVVHEVLLPLFAFSHHLFLRGDAALQRSRTRIYLQRLLHRIERDARRFRLKGDLGGPTEGGKAGSYFEIHSLLQNLLRMLKRVTNSHSSVLLWRADPAVQSLDVIERISDSPQGLQSSVHADQGVIAPVMRNGIPLRLPEINWARRPIPYYRDGAPSTVFMAAPVKYRGRTLGAVCLDRQGQPYQEWEQRLAEYAADEVIRALMNEHLYQSLSKSRNDQSLLAAASKALSETLDLASVFKVALEELNHISPCDKIAVLVMDKDGKTVSALPTRGVEPTGLLEDPTRLPKEQCLIKWVLDKRQKISYSDISTLPTPPIVFRRGEDLSGMRSLLIMPMASGQRFIGVVVMAGAQPELFNPDNEDILQVVVNQVAACIENATMYEAMERMAITDSLTGLHNRRHFLTRLNETVARAHRSADGFCLVMGDLDHFKQVNDTYGHPMGDQVLKKVAQVISGNIRTNDLAGRFGGEEFIVALDGADLDNARAKMEHVMELIRRMRFSHESRRFSVTMSFGLARFPEDADQVDTLISKADQALYQAKRSGRDRLELARDVKGGPS